MNTEVKKLHGELSIDELENIAGGDCCINQPEGLCSVGPECTTPQIPFALKSKK